MRLFTALLLTDGIQDCLARTSAEMKRHGGTGSFVPPENLHITLCFLGEATEVEPVIGVLDSLSIPALTLEPDGLGFFRRRDGDILIAKLRPNQALAGLHREMSRGLGELGFSLEARPFVPHITLARRFQGKSNLLRTSWDEAEAFSVDSVSLMQTVWREGGGVCYRELFFARCP